jgi:hypothetical protein
VSFLLRPYPPLRTVPRMCLGLRLRTGISLSFPVLLGKKPNNPANSAGISPFPNPLTSRRSLVRAERQGSCSAFSFGWTRETADTAQRSQAYPVVPTLKP